MERYHRLYVICLTGMGAGFIGCGILFVKLEIRTAWRVLSGRRDPGYREEERGKRRIFLPCRREERGKKRIFPLYRREKGEEPETVLLPKKERRIQKNHRRKR